MSRRKGKGPKPEQWLIENPDNLSKEDFLKKLKEAIKDGNRELVEALFGNKPDASP